MRAIWALCVCTNGRNIVLFEFLITVHRPKNATINKQSWFHSINLITCQVARDSIEVVSFHSLRESIWRRCFILFCWFRFRLWAINRTPNSMQRTNAHRTEINRSIYYQIVFNLSASYSILCGQRLFSLITLQIQINSFIPFPQIPKIHSGKESNSTTKILIIQVFVFCRLFYKFMNFNLKTTSSQAKLF